MATATTERDGDTLRVAGELNFDSVAELYAASQLFLSEPPIRQIDLGGIRHSNSAGVALLVEWLRQARNRRQNLVFIHIPPQMQAIIQVVELEKLLPIA